MPNCKEMEGSEAREIVTAIEDVARINNASANLKSGCAGLSANALNRHLESLERYKKVMVQHLEEL